MNYVNISMDNVCRTCLTNESERISINNNYYESGTLFSYTEMIQEIASIQVSLGDGFSSLICKPCVENLKKAFVFRLQCQKSDAIIRQSKINNSNIKTEQLDKCKDFYNYEIKEEPNFEETYIKTEVDVVLTESDEAINYEEKADPENKVVTENKNITNIYGNGNECEDSADLYNSKFTRKKIKTKSLAEIKKCKNRRKNTEKQPDHHFYELTENGEVQYPCFICKEIFKTEQKFLTHTKTHNENKPYICRQCGTCYTSIRGLKVHYKKHTIGYAHCCEICGKRFLQKSDLVIHTRGHTGEKPFSCPECNKTFRKKNDVKEHMQTHGNAKLYTCKICGKQLRKIHNHMNVHRAEKRYSCHICENKFTFKGELNKHIKVIHNGVRKFVCTVCKKTFGWLTSFNKHMLTHSDIKLFVCDWCGQDFKHKHVLLRHIKKLHAV